MYNNQYMIDNLLRQKDRLDEMIHNYQNPQQPVNNFFNTTQIPTKAFVEWRILNENEEVDNLYVANKTLFINDNTMVLKDVDGKLEKWEINKIYPVDKRDKELKELREEVKKLKEERYEHSKLNKPARELEQSNVNVDGDVKSKPKANDKSISKQEL